MTISTPTKITMIIPRTESLSFTWKHQVHLKFTKSHHDSVSVYNSLTCIKKK